MTPQEQELDLNEIELERDAKLCWLVTTKFMGDVTGMDLSDYATMDEVKGYISILKKQGVI